MAQQDVTPPHPAAAELRAIDPDGFSVFENLAAMVKDGPEAMTYFVINECGGFLFRTRHDHMKGRITSADYAAMHDDRLRFQRTMEWAVAHTVRFGVEFDDAVPMNRSPSYWAWFRAWDGYVKGLPSDRWAEFDRLLKSGGDVSEFHPGDWKAAEPSPAP